MHRKYLDLVSTPEGELVRDLEREIASLTEARNPTVLECQNNALKQEIAGLKATDKEERKLHNTINSSLIAKYESLLKESTQLKAGYESVQEALKKLEPQKKELQEQLIALKVSIDNMREVRKARYNVLDTRFNSLSI